VGTDARSGYIALPNFSRPEQDRDIMRKTLLQTAARIAPAGRAAALTGLVALGACAQTDRLPGSAAGGTPDQVRALTVSGMAAQADPGLAAMRRAALAAPSDFALQARYAGALARAGELLMAEDVVVAALARSPDHPALNQQLARIRVRGGQPQVALALFDRAALLQPSAEAEEGRGIALDMLGRHDEAQAAYRAALAQSPNLVSAQNNLAMSLMLTGRANEAIAVLEPLSRRRDAPARVANNLAVARSMAGVPSRVDVASADPREVREIASNLRATVGAGPAQPAPTSQFAAVEPGRGGATPIFPMDAAARSGFAAAAVPPPSLPPLPGMPAALPALPPAGAAPPVPQPATDLMPAPLPPRGTVELPPRGTVALPPRGTVESPPRGVVALPPLEPAIAALPVPAEPARPAAPPAAIPAVALAPASPAAAFAPMVITAVLLPSSAAAAPGPRTPAVQPAALVVPTAPSAPAAGPAVAAPPAPPAAATQAQRSMVVTAVAVPRRRAPAAPAPGPTTVSVPAAAALAPRQAPEAAPQPALLSVPAPRRAPADQAAVAGGHSVQVAALPSERAAQAFWSRLRVQLPQEFGDRAPVIARADLPQGTFWRLRTSGFTSATDARGFCQILRSHGRDCWVPPGN
jgi:Flp pilus assembly protein TadD